MKCLLIFIDYNIVIDWVSYIKKILNFLICIIFFVVYVRRNDYFKVEFNWILNNFLNNFINLWYILLLYVMNLIYFNCVYVCVLINNWVFMFNLLVYK